MRLLGGWVYRFRLMGLIFFHMGLIFVHMGFDSYDFGFTVLIFSVDGFTRFQEDESWVDRQWVDPFDQLLRLMA